MHPRSLATREQIALQSIVASSKTLAKQLGKVELAEQVATATHKDPQIASMRRMEAIATFMAALVDDKGNAKTLRESILGASDDDLIAIPGVGEKSVDALREWAATEPQPPVIVETVKEEELQTTETVETVPADQATKTTNKTGKK